MNQQEQESERQRAVTERIEREEFARGHIGPDEAPARPRAAATIVLARPGDQGFEVLLLRRPRTSRFAAGAFVFPGGTIDPGDDDPRLAGRMPQSGPDAEPAAVLAALRELFEETGLLLARPRPESHTEQQLRSDLLADQKSLGDALVEHDLSFAGQQLCYFARWITPARFSRRYDTRFFLTDLPAECEGFEPDLTTEIADFSWLSPARAIEMFGAGRLPMLFPTRVTLQALAEFTSVSDLFTVFGTRRIEALTPRLLIRGDSIRPVLPGDPEYDEADV